MSKVKKTIEVQAKEVKTIKPEHLKTIKEQQAQLQQSFTEIGFIESRKHEALQVQLKVAEALETTKKELEAEYGQINIDLKDGSYTVIENSAEPVMKKA